MPLFLKRLLFAVYVYFVRRKQRLPPKVLDDPVFRVKFKHAWFVLWHHFFWATGRAILSLFTEVRPIIQHSEEELGALQLDFEAKDHQDRSTRSFSERMVHATQYDLSEEATQGILNYSLHLADMAPWQYGVEARLHACKVMKYIFLFSLLAFVFVCNFHISGSPFWAWASLVTFYATMTSGAGWFADTCMYRIVKEATRRREKAKQKHPE